MTSIENPGLQREDRGFVHSNLHRLPPKTQREACLGGCSDLRISLPLPLPIPPFGGTVVPTRFVPDHSGVAVSGSHGVPRWAMGHLNAYSFLEFNYHN